MNAYDKDIGWLHTKAMTLCVCGHYEKSHRPMSRKCSLCDCPQFAMEGLLDKDGKERERRGREMVKG